MVGTELQLGDPELPLRSRPSFFSHDKDRLPEEISVDVRTNLDPPGKHKTNGAGALTDMPVKVVLEVAMFGRRSISISFATSRRVKNQMKIVGKAPTPCCEWRTH